MKFNKKGKLSTGYVEVMILTLVFIIILFKAAASVVPEGQAAGDELNASGVPLGSLFTANGVTWLIVMAGILFVVIRSALRKGK